MVIDPNGMNEWIPPTEKGGDWTAEPGDSSGSLARDAGISQSAAEGVMRDYNKSNNNNRSSDIMVYTGDKVSVPGSGEESSSSSSNLVMEEELGYASTPYADFATSVSSTLETNPNARYSVNVNADMQLQRLTYTTGLQNYTVGPNGISTGDGILSVGVNNQGQFIIGVSTPIVNGVNYSAEMRMNLRQLDNLARQFDNAVIITGSMILLKRVGPVPLPIVPVSRAVPLISAVAH